MYINFKWALWGFHTEIASSKTNNWSTVLPMLYKTWWPHIIWFFVSCFYENRRWREDLKTKRLPKTQPRIAGINSYFFKQIVLAKYLSNFEYLWQKMSTAFTRFWQLCLTDKADMEFVTTVTTAGSGKFSWCHDFFRKPRMKSCTSWLICTFYAY